MRFRPRVVGSPLALSLLLALATPVAVAYDVHVFGPASLPEPLQLDAVVGMQGSPVEDFEDTALVAGLTYLDPVSGAELSALPNLFSRNELGWNGTPFWIDDPWDGDHILTSFTQNLNSTQNPDLGSLTLLFAGDAAQSVGFGLSNLQSAGATWEINGVDQGSLTGLAGLTPGNGRNGYIRIDREPGEPPVASVAIHPAFGDSVTVDHVTFGIAVSTELPDFMLLGDTVSLQLLTSSTALPISWSLVGGSLPPGTSLDPNGQLAGVPTTPGSFTFTVRATDDDGDSAEREYTVDVVTCTPAPAGIVGWWSADGNAVDTVNGNDGSLLNGTTYVPGHVDEAFRFDGVDDLVLVPNAPELEPAAVTVETWARV